jgi:S-DNA-T family DNA segregation ATPase FtsK/SpoIIIE
MGSRKNIGVEVGSIVVFALGMFVLLSLITYHSSDPSLLTNSASISLNACGRIGAYLSSAILSGFGVGAFLLPVALFYIAATIHKRLNPEDVLAAMGGMTVAVSSLTLFFALQWKTGSYGGSPILIGGFFGTWLAGFLMHHLNLAGSSILTLAIFTISLAVSTPLSVTHGIVKVFDAAWMILRRALQKAAARFFLACRSLLKEAILFARSMLNRVAEKFENGLMPVLRTAKAETQSDLVQPREAVQKLPVEVVAAEVENEDSQSIKILPREVDLASKAGGKINRPATKSKHGQWQLPTFEFLKNPPTVESAVDRTKLIANSQILKQKFADFGIDGEVTAVRPGPVITLYEFKPGPGVKVSRIAALADDLSMALSAQSVRILAPLPGKSVVGIEIPSEMRETVYLREFLQHPDFYGTKHSIPVVMGKDIGGQTYLSDLARMPHLLCAGQTGSGKSVFMNGLICSLFYRFTPDELRMILVDPKFIEFRAYQDIPHLLLPVVDDPKQAAIALKWAVREMERRYRILAKLGARNLAAFNQKVDEMGAPVVRDLLFSEENQTEIPSTASGGDWIEAFEPDDSGAPRVGKLPYIVVIIDELADLMMIAKKEVEISIARIAQKARAAGIHLVIATQRPSTDVITGLIKANLPSRVSFQLASYVDSKTILDRAGAERLLGQGDMLFIPPGVSQNLRLHGAYLDDDEISKITAFLKAQGKPAYRDEILFADDEDGENGDGDESEEDDSLFQEGVHLVKNSGHASASFLQRHLKIGYNRAARMIETMESRGIVGPQDGARPREVLMRQ